MMMMQVPGNLVISARSGFHSFDGSIMNMSHVISDFSFGRKINARVMSDLKRILPYIGVSHAKLNGQAYLTDPEDHANVTVRNPSNLLFLFRMLQGQNRHFLSPLKRNSL